ncbi:MAG TPA: hypothetical protein VGF71_07365 [Caulobacteraceae bacterium]
MTTPYTQFAASQEVPPPYHYPGATVHGFVWEADMGAVQAYCDKFFNLPPDETRGFRYRPATFWPYAILLIINYPVMIAECAAPGEETSYQNRGVVCQKEAFVTFPVVRYGAAPEKILYQTALEWALPFIAVQNPMSACCGREMLGLGKLLADITTGEGVYPGSFNARVRLPGWRSDNVKQEMLPFLDVATAPALPTFWGKGLKQPAKPARKSLWSLFQSREAGWVFDGLLSAANLADDLSVGMAPTVMRTVSLRQIRDAKDPDTALYQALVTCRSHYDNVREFSFFNEADVQISFYDTGSLSQALRAFLNPATAPAGGNIRLEPKSAFQFTADIDFDQTRTIYVYTAAGENFAQSPSAGDLTAPWLRPLQVFFSQRS